MGHQSALAELPAPLYLSTVCRHLFAASPAGRLIPVRELPLLLYPTAIVKLIPDMTQLEYMASLPDPATRAHTKDLLS